MGTRADFYVGRGENAEWLRSIAWDGYPDGIDDNVLKAKTEKSYRKAVESFFKDRDDVTFPDQGWPWPWDNSDLTDYAYAFDNGRVFHSDYKNDKFDDGKYWVPGYKKCTFPNMEERKNVQLFGNRSGLLVLQSK